MLYRFLRPLLFQLSPELAHRLSFAALDACTPLLPYLIPQPSLSPCRLMGIDFPRRIGLAAGLDKNAQHIHGLAHLGFGFLEVGTVTPRSQPGNPAPRLFRLPEVEGLINRLGFNNEGVDELVARIQQKRPAIPLGINLGKNADTPQEHAIADYEYGFKQAYLTADYLAINISSPNTVGLRDWQQPDFLNRLLASLKQTQLALEKQHGCYKPMAVKIAPDVPDDDIPPLVNCLLDQGVDGVIATNTTLRRDHITFAKNSREIGGLSGAPLAERALEVLQQLKGELGNRLPIIAVGGIMSANDAVMRLKHGADLLQIYTGLIYRGPQLIHDIAHSIAQFPFNDDVARAA